MIMCSGIKRIMFDCYIVWFYIQERIKQVYVLDNDAFVRHSTNGLNTVCRIWGLEVILSDFNMWGRYLYPFSHFEQNNTLYELLRWYLQKYLNVTCCICHLEMILRRISIQVVTLYTLSANHSKNALYDALMRCCALFVLNMPM